MAAFIMPQFRNLSFKYGRVLGDPRVAERLRVSGSATLNTATHGVLFPMAWEDKAA
jgi:hypothetical protein